MRCVQRRGRVMMTVEVEKKIQKIENENSIDIYIEVEVASKPFQPVKRHINYFLVTAIINYHLKISLHLNRRLELKFLS